MDIPLGARRAYRKTVAYLHPDGGKFRNGLHNCSLPASGWWHAYDDLLVEVASTAAIKP